EPPRSGLQSEACDRHRRCSAPDGGHAGLRPRLKSSCFSARPSKSENRKLPAGQPSADNASAFFTQPRWEAAIRSSRLNDAGAPIADFKQPSKDLSPKCLVRACRTLDKNLSKVTFRGHHGIQG